MSIFPNRTRSPIEYRQQGADRLVTTERELRNAITIAAGRGEALNVRLANDITLGGTISIPAAIPSFLLDGAGHRILYSAPIGTVLYIASDSTFSVLGDETNTEVLIQDVAFEAASGAASVASVLLGNGGRHDRLRLRGVSVGSTDDLLDPAKRWTLPSGLGCILGANQNMHIRSTSGGISQGSFASCLGRCSVTASVSSGVCRFVDFNTPASAAATTANTSACVDAGSFVFVGCVFDTMVLRLQDVVVAPDAPSTSPIPVSQWGYGVVEHESIGTLVTAPRTVSLNATDPIIGSRATLVRVSVGAACAGNGFVEDGTSDGQQIILWCSGITAPGALTLVDVTATSNCRLAGNFAFASRASITLFWDVSDDNWQETSRTFT